MRLRSPQRFKEMKQLTKDTGGSLKSKSSASSEIQPIKLSTSTTLVYSDAPKRRPVSRPLGWSNKKAATMSLATLSDQLDVNNPSTATEENDPSGAVRNGWYSQRYDPKFITGCDSSCGACGGREALPETLPRLLLPLNLQSGWLTPST